MWPTYTCLRLTITCTPSGLPPWSLYERWVMRLPIPCGGIGGWGFAGAWASAASGVPLMAAMPSSILRCSRRVTSFMLPPWDVITSLPGSQAARVHLPRSSVVCSTGPSELLTPLMLHAPWYSVSLSKLISNGPVPLNSPVHTISPLALLPMRL